MHTYAQAKAHRCTHTSAHMCTHTYAHTHKHTSAHTYAQVRTHMHKLGHTCAHIHACTVMHICTHKHTHKCTHIHQHAHRYSPSQGGQGWDFSECLSPLHEATSPWPHAAARGSPRLESPDHGPCPSAGMLFTLQVAGPGGREQGLRCWVERGSQGQLVLMEHFLNSRCAS